MESYSNNRNSMNCVRNNMRSSDGSCTSCNQAMQNRERMVQQRRREDHMEQRRREEHMQQHRREEHMQQRRREEYMEQHRREERMKQHGRENENCDRGIEVECVCQVMSEKDCHRHDEMENLGCEFPVVMSYVPWQQWGDMYEAECGLMQGTIFKDLNFIFCGERC